MSIAIGNWAGALWLQQHSFSNFFWDTLYFPSIVMIANTAFSQVLCKPLQERRNSGEKQAVPWQVGNIFGLSYIETFWLHIKANVSTFSFLIFWVLTLFTSQGQWWGGLPKLLLWTRATQGRGSNWDRAMLLLLEQILVRIKQFKI